MSRCRDFGSNRGSNQAPRLGARFPLFQPAKPFIKIQRSSIAAECLCNGPPAMQVPKAFVPNNKSHPGVGMGRAKWRVADCAASDAVRRT